MSIYYQIRRCRLTGGAPWTYCGTLIRAFPDDGAVVLAWRGKKQCVLETGFIPRPTHPVLEQCVHVVSLQDLDLLCHTRGFFSSQPALLLRLELCFLLLDLFFCQIWHDLG